MNCLSVLLLKGLTGNLAEVLQVLSGHGFDAHFHFLLRLCPVYLPSKSVFALTETVPMLETSCTQSR